MTDYERELYERFRMARHWEGVCVDKVTQAKDLLKEARRKRKIAWRTYLGATAHLRGPR